MSYPEFPEDTRLPSLQRYVAAVCDSQGWNQASDLEVFLLFAEEVGELAKAIRHARRLFVDSGSNKPTFELREEFADVFSYLLDLANRFEVDLEAAFREKEGINRG